MANRHTKAKALCTFVTVCDAPTNWDRVRQRMQSLAHRGTKIPIISMGIQAKASNPQELHDALVVALEGHHVGQPEN